MAEEVKENTQEEIEQELPIKTSSLSGIIEKINAEEDLDKVKDLTKFFQLAMMKKEMNRAARQSDVLDYAIEEVNQRLLTGDVSDKALGTYVKVLQDNINNIKKSISNEELPAIQINHQEININNGDTLTKEERDNVIDFIQKVLTQSKSDDIIDIESSEKAIEEEEDE